MLTLHNQSVFNPQKWNYSHTITFTNGPKMFAICHDVPADLKAFADQVMNETDRTISTILEVLPDGEVVQELNFNTNEHQRFIAHSTAQAKRRAQVAPVEAIASVIPTEQATSGRILHADISENDFDIVSACGNSSGEMRSYSWVDSLRKVLKMKPSGQNTKPQSTR